MEPIKKLFHGFHNFLITKKNFAKKKFFFLNKKIRKEHNLVKSINQSVKKGPNKKVILQITKIFGALFYS